MVKYYRKDAANIEPLNTISNSPEASNWIEGLGPIGSVIGVFDTVNDILYNSEDTLSDNPIYDAALRGTSQDRHFLNQTVDLGVNLINGIGNVFGLNTGLKTSADREIDAAKQYARNSSTDFSNVRNINALQNVNIGSYLNTPLQGGNTIRSEIVADTINPILQQQNMSTINSFSNAVQQANQRQLRQNMMNYFDEGGSLEELNGVTKIGAGSTHEQNPYEGVQMGIAPDNLPNLVEEGEIVYKDYVYSNRLKPSKSLLKQYNLPEKYAGKSFAEIGDKLQQESKDRPNDPISKTTLDEWMLRLQNAQEEYKAKQAERKLAKMVDNMSTEEKAILMSSLDQPMVQQEGIDLSQPMYAEGGKIYIKPSKRGTFTAAAKKHGKSVQAFASQVLAHPENYSPAMRKKANFARNSAKWKHQDGGDLYTYNPNLGFGSWYPTNADLSTMDKRFYKWLTDVNNYDVNGKLYKSIAQQYPNWIGTRSGQSGMAEYAPSTMDYEDDAPIFNILAQAYANYLGETPTIIEAPNVIAEPPTVEVPPVPIAEVFPTVDNSAPQVIAVPPVAQAQPTVVNAEPEPVVVSQPTVSAVPQNLLSIPTRPTTIPIEAPTYTLGNTTLNTGYDAAHLAKVAGRANALKLDAPTLEYQAQLKPGFNAPLLENDITEPLGIKVTDNNRVTGNNRKRKTIPTMDASMLRYAPAVGAGLGALIASLQPVDYNLAQEYRNIASQLNPIAAPHIGGYRRYVPYDVNLGDVENLGLLARALDINRGQNRATQGALNAAIINKAQETNAKRNLAAQQANEANRLATDTYNLGIDQFNAQRDTEYDKLNQQILNTRLNTLASAAQAADASRTAWANMINTTGTNFFNQLGNVGIDTWNRNQRNWLLNALGREGLLELFKSGYRLG